MLHGKQLDRLSRCAKEDFFRVNLPGRLGRLFEFRLLRAAGQDEENRYTVEYEFHFLPVQFG